MARRRVSHHQTTPKARAPNLSARFRHSRGVNDHRGRATDVRRDGDMLEEDRGRRRGPGLLAGAIAVAAAASLGTLALVESTAGPQIAGSLAASFVNPAPDGGGGKGGATPTPDGKGEGQPTPTPTGKGKGFGSQPTITTLATAQQAAGFRVRTLDGLPGAQLVRVTVQTVTFDTAPGQPTVPSVTLVYSLGQTQVSITEVRDPLPMPAAQTYADVL